MKYSEISYPHAQTLAVLLLLCLATLIILGIIRKPFTICILRTVNCCYYYYSFIFFHVPHHLGMRERAVYHVGYSHYNHYLLNDLYSCNYNNTF